MQDVAADATPDAGSKPIFDLPVANTLGVLWSAIAAAWTVAFVWSIFETRRLIAAVTDAGGGEIVLSQAVWDGRFQGVTYNLAPDGFILWLGAVVTYGTGVLILIANLLHVMVRGRAGRHFNGPKWKGSLVVASAMIAIVVIQLLIMYVFRTELSVAGMHTDT